jgi:hypothetical protein
VEAKRARLTPEEETQSSVTILAERKEKVGLLLDSYHALIDIHSLSIISCTNSSITWFTIIISITKFTSNT